MRLRCLLLCELVLLGQSPKKRKAGHFLMPSFSKTTKLYRKNYFTA
jgi:hypothetical protein